MKKFVIYISAVVVVISNFVIPLQATTYKPVFDVGAGAVYMINLDSNMVMYEKDKDKHIHPGGLAQIMTVILALESGTDLENTQVTMKSYIENNMYLKNKEFGGIALAGLLRGETVSLKKLLYAVMLPGANEASSMVADYVADGSINFFVEKMNKRAKELGAINTNFLSPHGLPDESYTTAYDMYLITSYAMKLPGFIEMATTTTYDGGPTNKHETLNWLTSNKMMVKSHSAYYQNIKGIKASSTSSGSNVISIAQKGGYTYMSVVMGCPTTNSEGEKLDYNASFATTKQLYEWAFETFKVKTLLEKGKNFGEIKLKLAWSKDFVRLMAQDSFTALIPDEIEPSSITYKTNLPDYIKAPIEKGQTIGNVELILAGEKVGTILLVSSDTVEANKFLVFADNINIMVQSYVFKFLVVLFVSLIVFYVTYTIIKNRRFNNYSSNGRR